MASDFLSIIFSCDRALQLDAALKSFFLHCEDANKVRVNIIYKATNSLFQKEYSQLAKELSGITNIKFIKQTNFRSDVLKVLSDFISDSIIIKTWNLILISSPRWRLIKRFLYINSGDKLILFSVDDNLFVQDFQMGLIGQSLKQTSDSLGFSLRLGMNIKQSYITGKEEELPNLFKLEYGILKFNWTEVEDDWRYPLEVSSPIYRIKDLLPFLSSLKFNNPNSLESQISERIQLFASNKPYLSCFEQSVAFCNPVNKVQKDVPNRAGTDPEYSSESLAKKFEAGYRLDIEAYSGFIPNACHQEVPLILRTIAN